MSCLFFVSPGIKDSNRFPPEFATANNDSIFLSNPLYQESLLARVHSSATILREGLFLASLEDEKLNSLAKHFSRDWFLAGDEEIFLYRGINLASLFTHRMFYSFLSVLRALVLCDAIEKKIKFDSVVLLDDGSYWTDVAKMVFGKDGRRVDIISSEVGEKEEKKTEKLKVFIKKLLMRLVRINVRRLRGGGVIYSSSLRYATPFLKKSRGNYYLRDIFSFKAFLLGFRHSFALLLPEYFLNANTRVNAEALDRFWIMTDEFFGNQDYFKCQDYSLWPIVKSEFEGLIRDDFPRAIRLIDSFFEIFDHLTPKAVLVDEDVCFFNKTLVLSAQAKGIPSYGLLNGVPFFDVGSVPPSAGKLLVWGDSSKERLRNWGVPEDRMLAVGAPQYEGFKEICFKKSRDKVLREFKISPSHQIIVLATQPFHTNERPDYFGTPLVPDTIEKIVRISLGFLKSYRTASVIIKLHPGEQNRFFTEHIIRQFDSFVQEGVRVVKDYDTPTLIASSDLVLTIGSTVYFEALLLRKPAFLFDYPEKRYFRFMSPFFLNIENEESSIRTIREFFTGSGAPSVLERQKGEIQRHFYRGNISASEEVMKLFGKSE